MMVLREHQIRMCLGCRGRDRQEDLLRFVLRVDEVIWDRRHRGPGRGVYLHRAVSCFRRIKDPACWERGFRVAAGTLNGEALARMSEAVVAAVMAENPEDPGSLARQARKVTAKSGRMNKGLRL